MQRIEDVRGRILGDGGWFRVGLISTTLAAPLLARWNELRGQAKQASADASTPLGGARRLVQLAQSTNIPQKLPLAKGMQLPPTRERNRPDPRLWLVGVGVGLVATGAVAYFVARQRLVGQAEDLLELPLQQVQQATRGGQTNTGSTTTNAANNGHAATQTATSQMTSTSGATQTMTPGAGAPTIPAPSGMYEPASVVEPGMPEPEPNIPAAGTSNPKFAHYVGNIHTMIFHDILDTDHLPTEENRVYFETEEEARQSGFRHDRDEVPPAYRARES